MKDSYDLVSEIKSGTDSDSEVIATYFRIFDDLYFFGSLYGNTEVRIISDNTGGKYAGFTRNYWKRIFVHEHEHHPDLVHRGVRIYHYIQTLLHEMCHAFFGLYGCREEDEDMNQCKECSWVVAEGGHGPAWADMARAIERSSEGYLGLPMDLPADSHRK